MQETIDPPTAVEDPQLHKPCDPVEHETGGELDLASNPDYGDVFRDLSEGLVGQEIAETPFDIKKYPPGKLGEIQVKIDSAKAIKRDLGCAGCELSGVCLVEGALDEIVAKEEITKEREKQLGKKREEVAFVDGLSPMLKTAYEDDAIVLLNNEDRTESIQELLWGVEVTSEATVKAETISQIENIATINGEADCESYEISIGGREYTIIDASRSLDVNGVNPPSASESSTLFDKFFERLKQVKEDNNPRLATPDDDAQNRIKSARNDYTFEIRMAGKSRLYFIFENNEPEGTSKKIILLGAHGDNEDYQNAFIDAIR